jgi:hypothetical protein
VGLQDDDSRQVGRHACGAVVHRDFARHVVCGSDLVDEQKEVQRGLFARYPADYAGGEYFEVRYYYLVV